MDIFDRIAAAVKLMISGVEHDAEELVGHIEAIDEHLTADDTHTDKVVSVSEENSVDEDTAAKSVITGGLTKIVEAANTQVPTGATPVAVEPAASDTPATE